jgi:hypothetical protein
MEELKKKEEEIAKSKQPKQLNIADAQKNPKKIQITKKET